jgi:hypothetical protein
MKMELCKSPYSVSVHLREKTIRKWAAELYKLMVKRKQTMDESLGIHGSQDEKVYVTPLDILKARLTKGEITKAEYEELRKVVD